MDHDFEPRRSSLGSAVFAVSVVVLMTYLTFAALQGEHGLFRLLQIEAQESRMQGELETLRQERTALAGKTARLSEGATDLDLLDEQARKVLGLGRPDEIMIR